MNGIINVYKPKGFTSFDVVAKLKGLLHKKKIGHTGTLDPEATGVLPVCIGNATKVCELLTDKDKVYETVMHLGISTDTQDFTGEVLSNKEEIALRLDEASVVSAINSFVGEYDQLPPMYSALKVNGKRLYELAREGKTVERKTRRVNIFSIDIIEISLPLVKLRVHCSKGTYIRTLCNDIGELLGVGASMDELVRTRVSVFTLEDAYDFSALEALRDEGNIEKALMPVDAIFDYRSIKVKEESFIYLKNGNKLILSNFTEDSDISKPCDKELFKVYDHEDNFFAVYEYNAADELFKIKKFFGA